jgi:hypothetical protein
MGLVGKSQNHQKCFKIDKLASITQRTLKRIIVGRVLWVEVHIRLTLEMMAKIYNHQNCFPRRRPGKMIAIFVAKPQASTVLTLVQ